MYIRRIENLSGYQRRVDWLFHRTRYSKLGPPAHPLKPFGPFTGQDLPNLPPASPNSRFRPPKTRNNWLWTSRPCSVNFALCLGETQESILLHPHSTKYKRVREKRFRVNRRPFGTQKLWNPVMLFPSCSGPSPSPSARVSKLLHLPRFSTNSALRRRIPSSSLIPTAWQRTSIAMSMSPTLSTTSTSFH